MSFSFYLRRRANMAAAGFMAASLSLSPMASAVNLVFDYSYDVNNFFTAERRSVLEAAGEIYSVRLTDSLGGITPGGVNNWTAVFTDPGTLNSVSVDNSVIPVDTIVVYAGAADLGGSTLGIGGPGGYGASGTFDFLDSLSARGQDGVGTTDVAPWGGAITFDTGTNWYVDDDTSTDEAFAGFDLFSVALHELAHLLGVGTTSTWEAMVNAGAFEGAASMALYGSVVPLDADTGHFANGTTSTINGEGSFESAFDPSIFNGQRKRLTDLDWAAMSDLGWEVTPVPVPASAWLMLSALIGLRVARKR